MEQLVRNNRADVFPSAPKNSDILDWKSYEFFLNLWIGLEGTQNNKKKPKAVTVLSHANLTFPLY